MLTNFLTLVPSLSITQDAVEPTEIEAAVAAINGDMGMLWMLLSGILVFFMQANDI